MVITAVNEGGDIATSAKGLSFALEDDDWVGVEFREVWEDRSCHINVEGIQLLGVIKGHLNVILQVIYLNMWRFTDCLHC